VKAAEEGMASTSSICIIPNIVETLSPSQFEFASTDHGKEDDKSQTFFLANL